MGVLKERGGVRKTEVFNSVLEEVFPRMAEELGIWELGNERLQRWTGYYSRGQRKRNKACQGH